MFGINRIKIPPLPREVIADQQARLRAAKAPRVIATGWTAYDAEEALLDVILHRQPRKLIDPWNPTTRAVLGRTAVGRLALLDVAAGRNPYQAGY